MELVEDLGLKIYGNQGLKRRYGIYKCPECSESNIHATSDVKNGKIKRCKKCATKIIKEKNTIHGEGNKTKLWKVWSEMNQRCNNINHASYSYYGGRGIKVCDEWKRVANKFIEWARANGYKDGLTIDRINNDGNYEPSNCEFKTRSEQALNRRRKKNCMSKYEGVAWHKQSSKWRACVSGKWLGTFLTENDAFNAVKKWKDEQLEKDK